MKNTFVNPPKKVLPALGKINLTPKPKIMRLLLALLFVTGFAYAKPDHWNQFRGPNGDGDAGNADLPVEFSEEKNLTWKTPMPGKAWSSPIVSEGKVWVKARLKPNGQPI